MDFGLAKEQDLDRDLTATGEILGTQAYMSPEQARGAKLDLRSDIYSLAIVIFELFTRRTPLDADDVRSAAIPEEFKARLQKALAPDPAARYADATEMVVAIREAQRLGPTPQEIAPKPLSARVNTIASYPAVVIAMKTDLPQDQFVEQETFRQRVRFYEQAMAALGLADDFAREAVLTYHPSWYPRLTPDQQAQASQVLQAVSSVIALARMWTSEEAVQAFEVLADEIRNAIEFGTPRTDDPMKAYET